MSHGADCECKDTILLSMDADGFTLLDPTPRLCPEPLRRVVWNEEREQHEFPFVDDDDVLRCSVCGKADGHSPAEWGFPPQPLWRRLLAWARALVDAGESEAYAAERRGRGSL